MDKYANEIIPPGTRVAGPSIFSQRLIYILVDAEQTLRFSEEGL